VLIAAHDPRIEISRASARRGGEAPWSLPSASACCSGSVLAAFLSEILVGASKARRSVCPRFSASCARERRRCRRRNIAVTMA
jgi:hypothetical protein